MTGAREPTPPEPPISNLRVAWFLTAIVMVAAGWAAMQYRGTIAEAWPPSLRLYHALGLEIPATR